MKNLSFKFNHKLIEFQKFITVGALRTILGYFIYSIFIYLNFSTNLALFMDYAFGITTGFFANKYWTFNTNGQLKHEALRYLLFNVLLFFVNSILLNFLISQLSVSAYLAQLVVLVLLTFVSYVIQSKYIFRKQQYVNK